MRTRRKKEINHKSTVSAFVTGVLVSVAVLLAGAAVLTTMIINESIDLSSSAIVVYAVTMVAVFLGSFMAVKIAREENRIGIAGGTALIDFAVLVCTNVLFFDSDFHGVIGSLIATLAGAVLTLLLTASRGKRRIGRSKVHSR